MLNFLYILYNKVICVKFLLRFIKYLLISIVFGFTIANFSIIVLATIKKEDYKLTYKKIISAVIKKEEKKKPAKILILKRLGILTPDQLLKSKLVIRDFTLEEIM